MIHVLRKEDCCGCNACGDVCPKQAISFISDDEGFLYPRVDNEKCIKCNLCERVCPQVHAGRLIGAVEGAPSAWAAVSKNVADRFASTSGGVFTVCAEKILDDGGLVGGAVWGDDFVVHQIVSDDKTCLPRLRRSKYSQSDARGFYNCVKAAVGTGRPVFVCGTPCQMVALRLVVGNPENLFTADFICRGISSSLAFAKYIRHFEDKYCHRVIAIEQKNKELGWRRITTKATFDNGDIAYEPREESPFFKLFLESNMLQRPSCYECRCKGLKRVTDMTLSDCWGVVEKLDPRMFDKDIGTSQVLCHSEKGRFLWASVEDRLNRCQIDLKDVLSSSNMLCRSLPIGHVDRTMFYNVLREQGIDRACEYARVAKHMSWRGVMKRMIDFVLRMRFQLWRERLNVILAVRTTGLVKWLKGEGVHFVGNVEWEIDKTARFEVKHRFSFGGSGVFRRSSLESRVVMQPHSSLEVDEGGVSYGCNVQIYQGGSVKIGEGLRANLGIKLICAKSIKIGRWVAIGHEVTIRDYHGHYLNGDGYQPAAEVEIGDHVWICEHSTIMPGVRIGSGAVIASHSLVNKDVPPNTLVAGIPARVIRSNVQWKY